MGTFLVSLALAGMLVPASLAQQAAKATSTEPPRAWLGVFLASERAFHDDEAVDLSSFAAESGGPAGTGPGATRSPAAEATEPPGVRVAGIIEGSAAETAGLRAGDRILSVDGIAVTSPSELITIIARHQPDSWVSLLVQRKRREFTVDARLVERPEDPSSRKMIVGWIGVEAIDLPRSLQKHFGAPSGTGVMISRIVPGGPAESAGLALGDVVYAADGRRVSTTNRLAAIVRSSGVGNKIELTLIRDGSDMTLEALVEKLPEVRPTDADDQEQREADTDDRH